MAKKSGMTLYSDNQDIASHQVRIALEEKAIAADIIWISDESPAEELLELNPYGTLPTLVDRELVLYRSPIILEYLEERFPHPPLMPVYPVARAKSRLMMFRIEQDWYSLLHKIEHSENSKIKEQARKQLAEYFVMLSPVFEENTFFLSDDFSLVDCYIAPLLWRLPSLGVELPSDLKGIREYQQRVFSRSTFKNSLSKVELELRETETTAA